MLIDCDVHPAPTDAFYWHFLPSRWREHFFMFGARARQPFTSLPNYQPMSPYSGMRLDTIPADGSYPGSSLTQMREQLLDRYHMTHAIMLPLMRGPDERHSGFAAALVSATNEWQAEVWCAPEPRLRASIHITLEDTSAAIQEIEKRAGDRRFVQVMLMPRGLEPLGRPRYWPVLQACANNGLPVAVHQNGTAGHPATGGGTPSFYAEAHATYPQSSEALVTSLVVEGVFEHIPDLRIVLVESGFAWLPSLTWRLDKHYRRLRQEVPHLKRLPSEYIREHIWLTTQPIEEPERSDDLLATCEWIGWDRLMFSTDYPHWDFDDPQYAFKVPLTEQQRRMVFWENAQSFYGL